MDAAHYYRSLSQELDALKGRVRHLIQDHHWQTDGEWKESVLRALLRRHLPRTIGVGRGFIVGPRQPSSQIDVLLYDTSFPVLHQDGDLVFVTADAVRAIIEVKATLRRNNVPEALRKLAENASLLPDGAKRVFLGLFGFEEDLGATGTEFLFSALKEVAQGERRRAINHVCVGHSRFVRFWANDPEKNAQLNKWYAYNVEQMAFGYFVFNALEKAVGESVKQNLWAWFPRDGKEMHRIAEGDLK
ncbi:MAG TPA: DUF6602 domain-containing protein [Longimicrobium sp.]